MAAMAARTVPKRIMTLGLGDTVFKVLERMHVDDYSPSPQLCEVDQVKPSKQKESHGVK